MMARPRQHGSAPPSQEWLEMAQRLQPEQALRGQLLHAHHDGLFGALLVPLLVALGYRGDWRGVAEALPFGRDPLDLLGLRDTLARLSFTSYTESLTLAEIHPGRLPCLFLSESQGVLLVLRDSSHTRVVFNAATGQVGPPHSHKERGMACFFEPLDLEEHSAQQLRSGWFALVIQRFRQLVGHLLLLTLFITVLQILFPLFVMTVYDRVLGSGSIETLRHLLVGVSVALLFDWLLRKMRANMAVYVGARMDGIIGCASFLRVLSLPIPFTERSPVGVQMSRFKEFDSLRAFLTTPVAMLLFDMPFSLILLLMIAYLGGMLVLIPLVTMGLFLLLWYLVQPLVGRDEHRSRLANSRKQAFAMECLNKMAAIRYCNAERIWLERFQALSAQAAQANRTMERINIGVQTLSQLLVVTAGVMTIAASVFRVLAGEMSGGALVAIMILVWKVLSPIQSAFLAISRLQRLRYNVQQINLLMNALPEREEFAMPDAPRFVQGHISFAGVSIRYSPEAEPALAGVSFEIKAGETVAIVGPNGSGKSTILKLLLGLYAPQAGSIRVDGTDIRRIPPLSLRHAVGYMPQSATLYHGSIAQNLRFCHPLASDQALEEACRRAMVHDAILALPEGYQSWVGDSCSPGGMARHAVSAAFIQKISLARLYLKAAREETHVQSGGLLLLDEPTSHLDREADLAFMERVRQLRGRQTLLIVTHRPSHMRLADRIFYFERGMLRLAGPAAEVLPQIVKEPA
ncbi:MAG: ATP-binding cassette domain-containing protein [Magnetococcales bacterium]|nr:ATP-binding cassette domain-containing protein [Magnetococcales bacterium]